MDNQTWHNNDLKTRQGEIIVPADFGKHKTIKKRDNIFLIKQKEKAESVFKKTGELENILSEITYKVIAEELEIESVNIKPAIMVSVNPDKSHQGFLMENFVKNKNQKEVPSYKILDKFLERESTYHTVNDHVACLALLKEEILAKNSEIKKVVIDKDIRQHLLQIFYMDYITVLSDRHDANITYLFEQKGNTLFITLAKNYDNSFAFDLISFIQNFNIHTVEDQINYIKDYTFFDFGIFSSKEIDLSLNQASKELAVEINKNPKLKNLHKKAKEIKFETIEKRIKLMLPEKEIPKKMFDYINSVLKTTTELLDRNIEATNQKQL